MRELDIHVLRAYYEDDVVFITNHAAERCRQRGIVTMDIRHAVMSGEIIEQYPDDYPFPSCLICGKDSTGRTIHVCMGDEGGSGRIITTYLPTEDRWHSDFKTRRKDLQ